MDVQETLTALGSSLSTDQNVLTTFARGSPQHIVPN